MTRSERHLDPGWVEARLRDRVHAEREHIAAGLERLAEMARPPWIAGQQNALREAAAMIRDGKLP